MARPGVEKKMDKKFEDKIFKDFPDLFPGGRNVNPEHSLICFGLECDSGWYSLIYELCESITKINKEKTTIAVQVKEKFGGLRFYVDGGNEEIYDLIRKAEDKSFHICEKCGSSGFLRQDLFWWKTLCDKHCVDFLKKRRYLK